MAITKTSKTPKVAAKAPKAAKKVASVAVPKASKGASDTRTLRSEVYVLKMKHAMRELKETHKIKKARQALARHLTKLHNA